MHPLVCGLLHGSLFPEEVVDGGVLPDDGLVLLILVVEHLGVLEVLDEGVEALETGVGERADLRAGRSTFSLLNFPHRLPWNYR